MEISSQKSGDGSTNLQAAGDITVNTNTIALYSMEELAKRLLGTVFEEFSDETKVQISQNQKSYFQVLTENLQKIIKDVSEINKIVDSPDFQYISKKALISASRSSSFDLYKNLSSLIIQRVNFDNDNLKRIVYNEAISTIEKLTTDQLKILTLCFLLKRTKQVGLNNLDEFRQYLEKKIYPFLFFKKTNAEFEHLAYTGCASISVLSYDINALFKSNYPEIFKESNDLGELLTESHAVTELLSVWKNTKIQNMDLSSVGIVIASTFYEQTTGDRVDIDIWIN